MAGGHRSAWCRERAATNLARANDKSSHPFAPTFLFDAGIAPLLGFALRGVLWYQGESNSQAPDLYARLFPRLIHDWREHFGQGDVPFLFVQLPNMSTRRGYPAQLWPEFRDYHPIDLKD